MKKFWIQCRVPFQAKILHLWQYIQVLFFSVYAHCTVDIKYGPNYYYLHMFANVPMVGKISTFLSMNIEQMYRLVPVPVPFVKITLCKMWTLFPVHGLIYVYFVQKYLHSWQCISIYACANISVLCKMYFCISCVLLACLNYSTYQLNM